MYQNCLGQSWKHVCHGAYDHYNYRVSQKSDYPVAKAILRDTLCLIRNEKNRFKTRSLLLGHPVYGARPDLT